MTAHGESEAGILRCFGQQLRLLRPSGAAAAGTAVRPTPESMARSVKAGKQPAAALVVDGSNLAWKGRPPRSAGGRPSFQTLQAAIESLRFEDPDRGIHVDATLRHDVAADERPSVEEAIAGRHSGATAGRHRGPG